MESVNGCLPGCTGSHLAVPVLGGCSRRFVNLDNGASTPPLEAVQATVNRFMDWYGSVHRGAGFKSQLASEALDRAREIVLGFLGADPSTHTALFTSNTTESINRLAAMFPFGPDDVVIATGMEHHANDLPWRARATVVHAAVTAAGELDLDDVQAKFAAYGRRVRLLAVTGASNVTGFVNPIRHLARLAHSHGARIFVDAAQLAPHRRIVMAQQDAASSIDFLALSGHKMYAPYGAGALVAPLDFLNSARPDRWGGGAVQLVSPDEVALAAAPDRMEPGSPNTVGILALARAMQVLAKVGMDRVEQHEADLTTYALRRLEQVPGVRVYGSADPDRTADRLGVITFNVGDLPHGLVAAILAQEHAVGTRTGCFCAHPYVVGLLGIRPEEFGHHREAILRGDRSDIPGMVRASFGVYTTEADVDALVEGLQAIAAGNFQEGYRLNPATGDWSHPDYQPTYCDYFTLED